ncbi:glycosyltransferase [Kineococcus sp. SYSU DK006]|uniref:glycosyltransferase n=1 Tax=Kineococcus sp. SYSU DK006 TaxID=3383127 RepID=UPI003D7D1783
MGREPRSAQRIGYVVKVYPRFSETFVVREVLAREAAGEDIAIAALRPTGDTRFHALLARVQAPVTWIGEGAGRSSASLWQALREAAGLPGFAGALPRLLADDVEVAAQGVLLALWAQREGITHLHAHFATLPARTARHAAALLGIPYSLTAHAKDLYVSGGEALPDVLAEADTVVTVSGHNLRWLARHHPGARAVLVHNGLDLADFPFTAPTGRPRTVAAVGRLVPKKGFADLLDAIALLHAAGDPVRLRLAGSGACERELRAQARAAGLHDVVEFLGPLPQHEVHELVRSAAVFAAPCVVAADGDRDGLPTVVLEAMALGTPVVATTVTGIPEAVEDGVSGLLVPPGEPLALAAALRTVLDAPALATRCARAARARVEERFDARVQAGLLRAATLGVAVPAPAPDPVLDPDPVPVRSAGRVAR